jgi:predicted PurR-regulated permease PerM
VFAILVGLVLFGLLGALFACPAAGIIQTFVQAGWRTWRERHPDHFSAEEDQGQSPAGLAGHDEQDQSAVST